MGFAGTLNYMAPELLEGHDGKLGHPYALDVYRCEVACSCNLYNFWICAEGGSARSQLWRGDARGR